MTLSKLIISATLVFSGQAARHADDEKAEGNTPSASSSGERTQSSQRNFERMQAMTSNGACSSLARTEASPPRPKEPKDSDSDSAEKSLFEGLNDLTRYERNLSDTTGIEEEMHIPIGFTCYANNKYLYAVVTNEELSILKPGKSQDQTTVTTIKMSYDKPKSYKRAIREIKKIVASFPDEKKHSHGKYGRLRRKIFSKAKLVLAYFQMYLLNKHHKRVKRQLQDSQRMLKHTQGLLEAAEARSHDTSLLRELFDRLVMGTSTTGSTCDENEEIDYTKDTVDIFTSWAEKKAFYYDFLQNQLIILSLNKSGAVDTKALALPGDEIMKEMTKLKNGNYGKLDKKEEVLVTDFIKYIENKRDGRQDPSCEISRQRDAPSNI